MLCLCVLDSTSGKLQGRPQRCRRRPRFKELGRKKEQVGSEGGGKKEGEEESRVGVEPERGGPTGGEV